MIISLASFVGSGCGILIGNVKPVEEKADDYQALDLSRENPDWVRLREKEVPKAEVSDNGEPSSNGNNDVSDLAYQSRKTANIVSINSACRSALRNQGQDLKTFTQELLLGISDVTSRQETQIKVQDIPALQTTVQGKLNNEPVKLRTVVLLFNTCVYDLMYVARPETFAAKEEDFSRFVQSLRVR